MVSGLHLTWSGGRVSGKVDNYKPQCDLDIQCIKFTGASVMNNSHPHSHWKEIVFLCFDIDVETFKLVREIGISIKKNDSFGSRAAFHYQ